MTELKLPKYSEDAEELDVTFDIPDTPKALKCPHGFAAKWEFSPSKAQQAIKKLVKSNS